MPAFWSDAKLKRMLLLRLGEIGALVMLLVGCYVGYGRVEALEVVVEKERLRIASRPQYLLSLSALQTELRGRGADINRIAALVTNPQDIVQFIADIENLARTHTVVVEVPTIDEVILLDEAGQPLPATGPFRSIKLTISGEGSPEDLLEYVHKLEYGSRLVSLSQWDIAVDMRDSVVIGSALGAREIGEVAPESTASRPSKLNAEIILLVHNEKYSSQ